MTSQSQFDQPPRFAEWLLTLFALDDEAESILGDLLEEFFPPGVKIGGSFRPQVVLATDVENRLAACGPWLPHCTVVDNRRRCRRILAAEARQSTGRANDSCGAREVPCLRASLQHVYVLRLHWHRHRTPRHIPTHWFRCCFRGQGKGNGCHDALGPLLGCADCRFFPGSRDAGWIWHSSVEGDGVLR